MTTAVVLSLDKAWVLPVTTFRSAHAPCFSYGVSASSDSDPCYTGRDK